MKDNHVWIIGFFVGLSTVLAAVLVIRLVRSRTKNNTKYDERQLAARNAAYKYAFFSLLSYSAVCGILDMLEIKWATLTTLLMIGIVISATIFVLICIWKDAYDGINQPGSSSAIFLTFIGVVNLAVFIFNLTEGVSMYTNGTLNENILNLCTAVMFITASISQIIKNLLNKKAAEDK